MKQKFYFVYITTNIINGHFYIGKHTTYNLNDNYLGSGKRLRAAIKKYGIHNFKRRILCLCNTEQEVFDVEKFLVTDYLVSRPDCYNLHIGGDGGRMSEELNKKHSADMKDYYKTHQPWNSGKTDIYSDETRKKMSESHRGKPSYERSDEHKEMMRQIQIDKEHHFTEESKQRHLAAVRKPKPSLRRPLSEEHKAKVIIRCLYIDPDGNEHIMTKQNASRYHKDWKLVKNLT